MRVRDIAGRALPGLYRMRVLAALVGAACASDPTGGGEILVVAQIDVQPPGGTIVVGATQQLSATPKTSSGITVPNRTVTWTSEDQGVATVSTNGLVTGVSVGSAVISAEVDDVTRNVTINVTPKPVASVTVEPAEASLQVGESRQLQATPRDAQGQPLENRTVTWASDAAAVASVSQSGQVLAVAPGITTIRATSEGRTGTSTITVAARPATRLGFTTQPANGTAGQALAPIRVAVQDELGGTVTDAITSITLSIADNTGGATLGGTLTVNAVAGVATFGDISFDKSGAGYTLRASAAPLTPAVSSAFTIAAGAAARLAMVTQPSAAATSGAPFAVQPVVRITDANGNPVSQGGVAVSVQVVGVGATLAGNLTVQTAANGTATFTNLSLTGNTGDYTLRFISTGLLEATSSQISLAPGTPTGLLLSTPPSTDAQSGVPFAQQPVVQLRDDNDNPVAQAGVPVTASVASGGGALSGGVTVNTNASGQAAFSGLTLNGSAGTHTVAFSAPGLGQVVSPPITLSGGSAGSLGIVQQPSPMATNGTVLPVQPSIQVLDGSGNEVAQAGIVVTASMAPGVAGLNGTLTATTNSSGLAVFTNLMILGTTGTYRIRFDAPGLIGVESDDILLSPASGSLLQLVTQPAGAANGSPLSQQPRIQLSDMSGNPVPSSGVVVTAALATGPGVLTGTLTAITNLSGIAQFTDLGVSGAAGTYTIRFTAPGFSQAISAAIPLGAGLPTQLTITTQPSTTAPSGAAFGTQPVIQVRDAANNPVSEAGIAVTAAIATGGGILGGTVTVNTDASGVATFTNLAITGTVGNRTLQFSASGLTPVTSNTISITAGAAHQLGITVPPSPTAASGVAFAQQPVIQVQDASGNAVATAGIAVTASIEAGAGGTLGGTVVIVTNPSGVATFTNLALTGTSGDYTLRFSAAGLVHTISPTIGLGAGAASRLAIATPPSASVQNGAVFPQQPVIQLQDGSGNPVAQSGVVVTVTILSGSPALGGTLNATTNPSGVATFTNLVITGVIGDRTLIFAASGFVSITSGTVTVTPGSASVLQMVTQPAATAQSGVELTTQPAVRLVDQSGNAVSQAGVNVAASIASGGGTLGGTTPVATDGSGVATFTNLKISGLVGARTLGFASTGLGGTTSNAITLAAGPAAALNIAVQPSTTAINGTALAQQPQIQLRDDGGNNVAQAGVDITAAIGAGSPAGALTNATATTNASGLATFSGLTITGLVGTYNLQFTSGSLPTVTSGGITLSAGSATALSIATQPGANAQSGIAIPTQPAVQLLDQSGNATSTPAVTITAEFASSPGGTPSLVSATANTNGSGLATFSGLAITGMTGSYTLRFTSGSLTQTPASNAITLAAGSPSSLNVTVEPSANATNDVVLAQQPVVHVTDGAGNPVAGVSVTVSLTPPGGGTLSGASLTVATDAAGNATFSGLKIVGLAGTKGLHFAALAGALSDDSQSITLGAGAATQLAMRTQPSGTASDGVAIAQQPEVELRDSGGNLVTTNGVSITPELLGAGGALDPLTPVATVNGVAAFAGLTITGAGTFRIRFTAAGLTAVSSDEIVVNF